MRANRHGPIPADARHILKKPDRDGVSVHSNDVAVDASGTIVEAIARYHDVFARLTGRDDVRAEATRYEAAALVLVDPHGDCRGLPLTSYPHAASPLLLDTFFSRLYEQFDRRFVYAAPELAPATRRLEWDVDSPALSDPRIAEYSARVLRG